MDRILITGGTGTVGRAFISQYRGIYEFYVLGHSEKRLRLFLEEFPEVNTRLCEVGNWSSVQEAFKWSFPDIVIHAAAVKHVDLSERQPTYCVSVNILGSLNVLEAVCVYKVPIAIAVSTDKAAHPSCVYGCTKNLMEKCFVETGFAACRFGNVAGSAGSVIPIWKARAAANKPLLITHREMKRFMFSPNEAASLIQESVEMCKSGDRRFILTKPMKVVPIVRLAEQISSQIEITGIQPGEKLGECLISSEEACKSKVLSNGYIRIGVETVHIQSIKEAYTTENAEEATDSELRDLLEISSDQFA